jgi:GNAT superfamily N-acetyltransferase
VTQIREADLTDIDVIVALGHRFASESVYADRLTVSPTAMKTVAEWLLSGSGAIFLAERDGIAVAMIGLAVYPHFLSGQRYGSEVFWWCNPESRGLGLRLLREGEAWVREQGGTFMQLTAPSEDVERLYVKLGYNRVESVYSKEFPPC